jgi:DNA-binding response OmpR family regulator
MKPHKGSEEDRRRAKASRAEDSRRSSVAELLRTPWHASSMRLLVVEDEPVMAAALTKGLRGRGYAVDLACDGATALDLATQHAYEIVVLDRDLPVVHGDVVCQRLLATVPTPRVLMLTAADGVENVVQGFGLGADDYLAKPFQFAELFVRIDALSRRPGHRVPPVVVVGDVRIDASHRSVARGGRDVDLTPKEFGVLVELARAEGRIVTSEELLERVWDVNADPFTNAVRVTLVNLRKKLGEPAVIHTLRGSGYRLGQ